MSQEPLLSLPGDTPQPTPPPAPWVAKLSIIGAIIILGAGIGVFAYGKLRKPDPPATPSPQEQFEQLVARKAPLFKKAIAGDGEIGSKSTMQVNPVAVERERYPYIGEMTFELVRPDRQTSDGYSVGQHADFRMRYLYSSERKEWVWGYRDRGEFVNDNSSFGGALNASVEALFEKLEAIGKED
jgi:hypothetical protein